MTETGPSSPETHARLRAQAETLGGSLPALLIEAERVASTVIQGVHGRRRVGQGETFWQYRRYQPGDSRMQVDWRRSARSDALFVREMEWEAAQSVWIWRDNSPSMHFASSPKLRTKQERADLITLAAAALLLRGGERVGILGTGELPCSGRTGFNRFADSLLGGGKMTTGLPPADYLPRYSQVILVSDFLDSPDEIAGLIAAYAKRNVRGTLMQVLDPAEETLPYKGRVRFEGLEGEGETLIQRVETLRSDYVNRLHAHRRTLREIAGRQGWAFELHHTDHPPETALMTLYMGLAHHERSGYASR